MALGKKKSNRQEEFWIAANDLAKSPGHPFYEKLEQVLEDADFDRHLEALASPYYAEKVGRPSLAPGVYVRMLLVGYFEGIDSERGIAWRCADSWALRDFLGYRPTEKTPDHSTLSKTRKRLALEFHEEAFAMVLEMLAEKGLIRGDTVAVDATTMEANAAMRSLVRRETGDNYQEYLKGLALASGIETPSQEDLRRFDRKRKGKKTSNKDWHHPNDPDARVAKMKDGRTRMAYKAEHVTDLESGALLEARICPADEGDTKTGPESLERANRNLERLCERVEGIPPWAEEVVADKGYFSTELITNLDEELWRTYISEPKQTHRRKWEGKRQEKKAVYGNRRRVTGNRGKRLLKMRGEKVERSFQHMLDGGGMRRTHLRGMLNVAKRYLIQASGFNLALVMRAMIGAGKPREAASVLCDLFGILVSVIKRLGELLTARSWSRHAAIE